MVATPSSICRGPAIGWPLVVGGSTEPRCRVSPSTGRLWPSMGIWVNAKVDQPVTPGWPPTSLSICVGGQLSYPPWLSISSVQFQPYRAGLATSPVRLAPNTTAIVTAMTATTEPARVASTGTGRRPAPRSSASRVPTTALTGRPAAAAAAATDDARAAGASPGGLRRPPGQHPQDGEQRDGEHAAAAREHQRIHLHTTGGVELPDRAHRGER